MLENLTDVYFFKGIFEESLLGWTIVANTEGGLH